MPTTHNITGANEVAISNTGRYVLFPLDSQGQRVVGAQPVALARGDTINLTQSGRITTSLTSAQTAQLGNLGVQVVNGTNAAVEMPPALLTRVHLAEGSFSAALPVTDIGARDGIEFELAGRNSNDLPTGRILNNSGNNITKTGETGPLLVPFGGGTERLTVGHAARVTVTFGNNPDDSIVLLGHDVEESRTKMNNFRRRSAEIMQEALSIDPTDPRRAEALVGRGYIPAPRAGEARHRLLTTPAMPRDRLTPYVPPAAPVPKGMRSGLDGVGIDVVAVDPGDLGGFASAASSVASPVLTLPGPAGGRRA